MSGRPAAWENALRRYSAGKLSPQVTLAQLLLSGDPPSPERLARLASDTPALAPLAALAEAQRDRLAPLARLAAEGVDPAGEDMVAATRALFDRLAAAAPEAAVAFYSLGDATLLDRATAELIAVLDAWSPVAGRDVLDFGCGIGRVAIALAPRAASVTGIDLSPAMIAEAQRRGAGLPNLRFEEGRGRDLSSLNDASVDLMLAADSFPYLVRAGGDVLDTHLREAARVLRAGGDLLVFNWSYRGDVAADVAEARALAAAAGFAMVRAGERPFAIWDGIGFHLRRPE